MTQYYERHMFYKIYQSAKYRLSLILLLGKFIRNMTKENIKTIYHLIKNNESDQTVIDYISKNIPEDITKRYDSKKRSIKMAKIWFDLLKKVHPDINRNTKYLDLGSNNGGITLEFGKNLGLNKQNIYGIDVETYSQQKIKPLPGFIFSYYDGYHIPFHNQYFDLMTCSMVLHHIKHLEIILKEINRVLKNNGLLLIKEHDADSEYMNWLIFLEHLLYDVIEYRIAYNQFIKSYIQYTLRKNTLIELLSLYGFQLLYVSYPKKYNPTNHYYAIFQKKRNLSRIK
jgi:ubiquinone/menaquinone biosynthesis C-methylase UbiE